MCCQGRERNLETFEERVEKTLKNPTAYGLGVGLGSLWNEDPLTKAYKIFTKLDEINLIKGEKIMGSET